MIPKISFTSQYRFIDNKYQNYFNQEIGTIHSLQSSIYKLKEGDSVTITRQNDSSLTLNVPDYLDGAIENHCLWSGIEYKKED